MINSYALYSLCILYSFLPMRLKSLLPPWIISFVVLFYLFPIDVLILLATFFVLFFLSKLNRTEIIWVVLLVILSIDKALSYYDNNFKVTGLSFFAITASILFWNNRKSFDVLDMSFFFPHVAAGPIIFEKYYDRRSKLKRLADSLLKFTIGMAFLEMSGILLDRVEKFNFFSTFNPIELGFFYLPSLFSNFFGYSLVAAGYATLLGFNISYNFNAPGLAHNSKEFWRRWHISLSTFMRKYLFVYLRKTFPNQLKVCLIVTFLISGFWHGLGLGYFLWSLFFACLAVFYPQNLDKNIFNIVLWYFASLVAWFFFFKHNITLTELMTSIDFLRFNFSYGLFGAKALVYLGIVYLMYFIPIKNIFRLFGDVTIIQRDVPMLILDISFVQFLLIAFVFGIFVSEQIGFGTEFIYAEF